MVNWPHSASRPSASPAAAQPRGETAEAVEEESQSSSGAGAAGAP